MTRLTLFNSDLSQSSREDLKFMAEEADIINNAFGEGIEALGELLLAADVDCDVSKGRKKYWCAVDGDRNDAGFSA